MSPSDPHSSRRLGGLSAVALAVPAVLVAGLVAASPAPAAAAAPGSFATSFESSDPAAVSTQVETGADGNRVRRGISGPTDPAATSVVSPATAVTASASNGAAGGPSALTDADPATRWQALVPSASVTYRLTTPTAVSGYALTSAADAPDRDPAAWTLSGSTDGTTFTTLDTRRDQTFAKRGQRATFGIAKPASYGWYRLAVTAPHAGRVLQLADLDLTAAGAAAGPGPMVTATGDGPTEGLNIKEQAGFTGLHAYRYAGRQTATGRVYETNVIQDGLAVTVGPKTQLRYTIIPAYTDDDPTYPSTFAAIDLHFTDGTYLSQLGPVDQHGIGLTAARQGQGKILYADQWNRESSDLGAVAAGKTIDRVLLAYDDPTGTVGTAFGGWVDDIAIDPAPPTLDTSTLTHVVDTRRGTNASGSFSRGNNLPITAVPNGFTFLTPVTDASSNSWEYYYQQANNDQNLPTLQGFSVSHEPSPWMGDRNQLSVMPSASATPTGSPSGRALAFSHADETAQPDYYRVGFQNGLTTEMTPTDHGYAMRFTFPATTGSLVFDTVDQNGKFTVDPAAGTVTGWVDNGSGLSAGRSRMFFAGTFSAKPVAQGTAAGANAPSSQYATFDTKTVELRMATSFIGLDQARRNAKLELTGRSFDDVRQAATTAWQQRLGVVTVGGATDDQLRTLYGSLYRLNLYPNSQFENTGTAAAPAYQYASPVLPMTGPASDTRTSATVKRGKVYVNNGFWDTYRTVWPAYSLLYPEVAADLVDGFTQQYRDGGWIARWSSPGYADLMTGTSSDVAFAGAYLRGVPLKDPLATFDAAMKNATTMPTQSGVGRKGLATSIFQKYTDTSTSESVSWQLEGDINDAGLAQMATALAADPRTPSARRQELKDDAAYLADRAGQYVNLFDPSIGFFQGRDADGSWNQSKADYDPESWGGVYTETDGWNFAFHAPQDGQGLADLYGGRAALATKLDQFFSTPELADKPGGYGGVIHEMLEARAVRMGQYGHSNQPSHHIPYMYDYVQQPYKTQAKVREILQRLYVGSEIGQGYPGDEDNGEMSSWYVLSSLGIYPLQSGSPNWVIGSPLFTSATVHRSNGDLTITADGNSDRNIYVQSLQVNGKAHSSTSVTTQDLAGNARLDFTMGAKPSAWGTGSKDVPTSPTTGATPPRPDEDATTPGVGSFKASNGQDVSALTDDDQATQATFSGAVPALTWKTRGTSQRVDMYTLTSGTAAGDPTGWTVQASQDGRTWTTVDTRTAQEFRWRNQTRPFTVAHPGAYRMYRLLLNSTGTTSLSEVELLVAPGSSGTNTLAITPTTQSLTARVGSPTSATLATFLGAAGRPASAYTATIDWGDGRTSGGTLTPGQLDTYAVAGSHTYDEPGWYRVAVTVSNGQRTVTAEVGVSVAIAATSGIVAGFDSVCIADDGVAVDCDGVGYSYSRQALAAAGAVQGTTIDVPGGDLHFVLPAVAAGQPDNAAGNGQTVPVTVPDDATQIAFVGAGTQGTNTTTATLRFSDGTSQEVAMDFPDWTLGGGGSPVPDGFTSVAASAYRLNHGSKDGAKPYLFAGPSIALPAGETLTGVTMPDQPGDAGDLRVHLFAIADNGTPTAPLQLTPSQPAKATTGVGTALTLGRATGGAEGPRTARVQWGDESVTADATVTVTAGVARITGSHTWREAGTYTVHVTVSDGASSTTKAFRVVVRDPAQQAVAVSPSTVSPGARLTATGIGFTPSEKVTVALSTPITATTTVTADAQGRIAATLTVPSRTAAGTYALTATGAKSQRPVTSAFSVVDPAAAGPSTVRSTLVLSSTTATPGETVSAQGSGYRPNQDVSLIGAAGNGSSVVLAVVRANADGVIATSFVVPALAGGLVAVRTTNAASPVAAPARTGFTTTATPHGTAD
ncbi:GH92 family glycosyl hydrolase [Jatrophihabitans sp. YIM 134969]